MSTASPSSADALSLGKTAATRDDLLSIEALLVSRAHLYMLFHKLFGGEPTERLLTAAGSSETVEVLDEYAEESDVMAKLKDFASRLGKRASDRAFLSKVLDEFNLFFQGPVKAPALPWESTYEGNEAMVFQASTLAVRESYREQGLQVRRFKHMPDDHVSIMCAFMAEMSSRALKAFRAGNLRELKGVLASQLAFARNHLTSWLPAYAEHALHVKEAHLYPQLAQGVAAFAALDQEFAGNALGWIDELARSSSGQQFDICYDSAEFFGRYDEAYAELASIRPRGIEDNELVPIER